MDKNNIEQTFFRGLNALVEPLVRKGVGSPSFTPASLIVLETVGYKSGLKRSTPLMALRLGNFTVVSTVRSSSFWVKNLLKEPQANYYLGGRSRECLAYVMAEENQDQPPENVPSHIYGLLNVMRENSPAGWTFVILSPV